MANASVKKQAQANLVAIKNLHVASAIINALYIISYLLFRRPGSIKSYLILSLPAWIIEYQLDRIGRPKYSPQNGSLISAGEDLSQVGLTEWLWDIVYVTWGCDILGFIIGRTWVWLIYLVIPTYGSYMAYTSFIGPMLKQRAAAAEGPSATEPAGKKKEKKQKVKHAR
ncbi:hypothetical protein V1517DRAFT_311906 [Lipomyces orientalis]|uniref:Uncharacterized protein n=1 Tax=Lipomyces orientalis TaxID=1233043 RepID=A0ACC3TZD0_9ASCO